MEYVVIGLFIVFGLFFVGSFVEANGRTQTQVTPFTDGGQCEPAEREYIRTVDQSCRSVREADAAKANREAIDRQLVTAQLAAAGLLAGAIAASLVPIVGPIIAAPLISSYTVAQAYVVFLLGRLSAATSNERVANEAWARAFDALAAAEISMRSHCGQAAAAETIRSFPPCDPGGDTRPLPG